MKQIGIFLGYTIKIGNRFDGEGIGRFVIKLVEGLLDNSGDVVIHIATTEHNYVDVLQVFTKYISLFPNRLFIQCFHDVESLNQNSPVDVWILPYVALELALDLRKPIILCLHDLVYLHFKDMYYGTYPQLCKALDNVIYAVASKASKVAFNSNFTRNHEGIQFLKLPLEKTRVIRLASPVQDYEMIDLWEETEFRQRYHLYGDYIVYPSVIRLHKNHDRLIEAFLKFRLTAEGIASKLRLIVTDDYVGKPKEAEIAALLNGCKEEELRNSVLFLGRIPASELPSLYKYAKGTVVPTLFEGSCPFPILESLTMGTPVAMSKLEVIKEVIEDIDVFPTFDPFSVHEIQAAIHDLWKRGNIMLAKQKDALSLVLQRKWCDVAREYYDVINEIYSSK